MFEKNFKNVRQRCWELIDREFPESKDKYQLAGDILAGVLRSRKGPTKILDAGCGHAAFKVRNGYEMTIIGADSVFEDIKLNKGIDYGIAANLNSIPIKDNCIDVIVSHMVFEHLCNPEIVFTEFSRILKGGGYLVFTTPSVYGIVTILNRMLPTGVRRKLANSLTGVSDADVFPTLYRANSVRRLRHLLGKSGFTETKLITYQPPPYAFVFSKGICKLMICYYRLLNKYDRLKFLRGVIIGKYQKETKMRNP